MCAVQKSPSDNKVRDREDPDQDEHDASDAQEAKETTSGMAGCARAKKCGNRAKEEREQDRAEQRKNPKQRVQPCHDFYLCMYSSHADTSVASYCTTVKHRDGNATPLMFGLSTFDRAAVEMGFRVGVEEHD